MESRSVLDILRLIFAGAPLSEVLTIIASRAAPVELDRSLRGIPFAVAVAREVLR